MSISNGPNLGSMVDGLAGDPNYDQYMYFLRQHDTLVMPNVKSATTVAQPTSPTNGDSYILPTGATGAAWAGNAGKIARYSVASSQTAWEFYTPKAGWSVYVQDTLDSQSLATRFIYSASLGWIASAALSGTVPIANGGTGATTQPGALSNILGTSAVPITNGGTGATTAAAARTALGLGAMATQTADISITSQNGGPLAGLRNKVINGDMRVCQRGTSAALTASYAYQVADRWAATQFPTASGTISQIGFSAGGIYAALKLQRTAGSTNVSNFLLAHVLESINSIPLQGKQVTLSFLASAGSNFSAAGSSLAIQVFTGTGTDQGVSTLGGWTGSVTAVNTSVSITTSLTRYSATFTVAANATQIGIAFKATPVGTAGADDSFYVTNVQLECGANATPFEDIPFNLSQLLCYRYYYAVIPDQFPITPSFNGNGFGVYIKFMTPMRVMPSATHPFLDSNQSNSTIPAAGQWNTLMPGVAYGTRTNTMTVGINQTVTGALFYNYGATWSTMGIQMTINALGPMKFDSELT